MWDTQVDYFTEKGWNCLRFDMLGYGRSYASEPYLQGMREPYDIVEHIDALRAEVLPPSSNIIAIGLSIGGAVVLNYTIQRLESVSGVAVLAGGIRGFEYDNPPEEEALFSKAESLIKDGDVQGAANMMVRIWGDGPQQEPGRISEELADRLLRWNIDISRRDFAKTGGDALEPVQRDPAPATQLHTINVPTAVAYGSFDETYTNEAMKFLESNVKGAVIKEFETAHMINLEEPGPLNEWLNEWLETNFET